MGGHLDAALREAEAAVKAFERQNKPVARGGRSALRGGCRLAGPARGRGAPLGGARPRGGAGAGGDVDPLVRLLSLAATVASMRGEHQKAAAYLAEIERRAPKETEAEEAAEGGTLVVALANPVASADPAAARTIEEQEVLSTVFETLVTTDPQGNLVPLLCARAGPSWATERPFRSPCGAASASRTDRP